MARMTITEYQLLEFNPGSAPCRKTIIARIKRGDIFGEFMGQWYVDPARKPVVEIEPVNELVTKVLNSLESAA